MAKNKQLELGNTENSGYESLFQSIKQLIDKLPQKPTPEDSPAPLTAEEKLLNIIFQPDAPDGPGKTTTEYPEVHISDYLHRTGTVYEPGVTITVGDLVEVGRDYARQVLAGIESTDITDDGANFSWYSSEKYAPNIRFAVDNDTPLRHDSYGSFLTPISYFDAEKILPKIGFKTNGDDEHALVAWGVYLIHEGMAYFHASTAADATNILLIVPWGGAHSQTRGRADGYKDARFFDRQVSKRGGEGFDFYILDVEDKVDDLILTEIELNRRLAEDEVLFYLKTCKLHQLHTDYQNFVFELDDAATELGALHDELFKYPTAHKPYAIAPDCTDVYKLMPKEPPVGFDASLENLEQYSISEQQWYNLRNIVPKFRIAVDAWVDFAPRFDTLRSKVTDQCHGWMEIRPDSVKVWLPNNTSPMKSKKPMRKHTFAFSEKHLQEYRELVDNFIDSEATSKAKNDVAFAEQAN